MKWSFRIWILIAVLLLSLLAIQPWGYFKTGVVVKSVEPNSAPAIGGIKAGDVITSVNNQVINFNGNMDFTLNMITWLAGQDEAKLGIRPKDSSSESLSGWNNVVGSLVYYLYYLVIPGLLVLIGTFIWFKRRQL